MESWYRAAYATAFLERAPPFGEIEEFLDIIEKTPAAAR